MNAAIAHFTLTIVLITLSKARNPRIWRSSSASFATAPAGAAEVADSGRGFQAESYIAFNPC